MSSPTWFRCFLAGCLFLSPLGAFAQLQPPVPTYDTPGQHLVNGQPDPGVTTTDANGVTTTKFQDGWTKQVEPDPGLVPPGTKVTIKDATGRIREITRIDGRLRRRHHTHVDPVTFTTSFNNWREDGSFIDGRKEVDDPARPPKKVTYWNPTHGEYESEPPAHLGSIGYFSRSAMILGAVLFVLGLLIGRAWGARGRGRP